MILGQLRIGARATTYAALTMVLMIIMLELGHLDSFNVHPPGVGGLVQADLHVVCDRLTFCQNVAQSLRPQDIPVVF